MVNSKSLIGQLKTTSVKLWHIFVMFINAVN